MRTLSNSVAADEMPNDPHLVCFFTLWLIKINPYFIASHDFIHVFLVGILVPINELRLNSHSCSLRHQCGGGVSTIHKPVHMGAPSRVPTSWKLLKTWKITKKAPCMEKSWNLEKT